jgi:hypothetical protein
MSFPLPRRIGSSRSFMKTYWMSSNWSRNYCCLISWASIWAVSVSFLASCSIISSFPRAILSFV